MLPPGYQLGPPPVLKPSQAGARNAATTITALGSMALGVAATAIVLSAGGLGGQGVHHLAHLGRHRDHQRRLRAASLTPTPYSLTPGWSDVRGGSPTGRGGVVELAQHEARTLGHDYIGTEHILLGLIDEGAGVATTTLTSMGINLDEMRQAVLDSIGHGAEPPPESGHIPFTPGAKKVLELSLREANQLGHNYIGTEHILLGLIREGGGAAQLLAAAGVDHDRARQQVIELLFGHREAGSATAPPPAAPAADELIGRLTSIATRLNTIEQRLRQSPPA